MLCFICPSPLTPRDLPTEMLTLPLSRLLFARPYSKILRQVTARRTLKHGGNKKTTLKDRMFAIWLRLTQEPRLELHTGYFEPADHDHTTSNTPEGLKQEYANILQQAFIDHKDKVDLDW